MNKKVHQTGKKHNMVFAALIMLLLWLCVSCSSNETYFVDPEPKEGEIKIYCTTASEDSLQWENQKIPDSDLIIKLEDIGYLLKMDPSKQEYKSAIPEDVKILEYKIGADEQLIITFSKEYNNMDGITEALCRAAVVLTYCQLDEIDYIEFSIEGQPLQLKDIPVGQMSDSDFLNRSGDGSDYNHSVIVTVFLTDENGRMLQESTLKVEVDGTQSLEETALEELIAGPLESQVNLKPVIPSDVKINKIRTSDGICYVDFNEKFMSKLSGVTDDVAVYSVVNTLCELPGITKVRITINGSDKKNYGKVSINEFLSYRPELITTEKAGE